MRILWVKANKLLPVSSGGDIRSYHVLQELSATNEVTFLSYYDGTVDEKYDEELQRHFPGAVSICTGKASSTMVARGLDFLAKLPKEAPYAVSRFKSEAVREQLGRWFAEARFDVAVCDFLDAAINFPEKLTIPTVLFQHNVESEIWRRHAETSSDVARKLVYKLEFAKMLNYERKIVRKSEHVIAVSENDRNIMSAWVDASRITVVPTGVDLRQFRPGPAPEGSAPIMTFVGAMDWEPNIDAVEYFCRDIWPGVLARVPSARFQIVGRNPDRRVRKWASESVEVTGSVASVVDYLKHAAVVVVPLRVGGGTRLKIYEAMAMAKALVSTTVGAEGLDIQHGENLILADEAESFTRAITDFLEQPELRRQFGGAAAQTAARYDWPVIGEEFGKVLSAVAGMPPASSPLMVVVREA